MCLSSSGHANAARFDRGMRTVRNPPTERQAVEMAMGEACMNQPLAVEMRQISVRMAGWLAHGIRRIDERHLLAMKKFVNVHDEPRFAGAGTMYPAVTRMLEVKSVIDSYNIRPC